VPALEKYLSGKGVKRLPFAPPFLKAGRLVIGQTANILLFLGEQLNLAPRDDGGRLWTHQLQLTIADLIVEAHDTHHPVGSGLYYEEQIPEAKRRAAEFLARRVPKYFRYFDRVLANNDSGPGMVGKTLTYADLSLAQVLAGLEYAFPKGIRKALAKHKRLRTLEEFVFSRPRIERYARSGRRLEFNNDDLYRHYPELDR
jgi:glutathione S-transferase